MALLNAEALAYIGRSSEFELACDAVEAGAVRRYAQAIMDDDPAYAPPEAGGGGLAPLLYPTHLFRRAWGTPDPIQDHASDPDFDGLSCPVPVGAMGAMNHSSCCCTNADLSHFSLPPQKYPICDSETTCRWAIETLPST